VGGANQSTIKKPEASQFEVDSAAKMRKNHVGSNNQVTEE
jgi:hypothetical protein